MGSLDAPLYMDARISAHRSLSQRGFWLMLAVLAVYNVAVMAFLLAIGALPVPIFLGLDFVGLIIAFRINNRRSNWTERVKVSADTVEVSEHRPPGRERTVWRSPTAFTRVEVERAEEHEASVSLRLSGRFRRVGDSLSPQERSSFGEALKQAILDARSERHRG